MKTATFMKELYGYTGTAKLYRLSEPVEYGYEVAETTEYVVVSATFVMFSGPETYIFPADESGNVLIWSELAGSYKGGLSHVCALNDAGFAVEQ